MNKNVCIVLQEIWRKNTSYSSRLGTPLSKCISSIVPEKSIISPINSPEIQKDKRQLSSKKQSRVFLLYSIFWGRLINPLIYHFTPGIKTVDQLAKLNDFRTFHAFGPTEGDAVHKTSVAHQKCLENPKPINVKNKLEIDDYIINDPYQFVNTGLKSKIFWENKIKYSAPPKTEGEGLPNAGYKSMLYNITLKKVVEAKIERIMPNINQGRLSYLCDLRAHKVDKDIAYVQEKIEPFVQEIKDSLNKVASELNKVAVEMGKEKCQGSMNLTASLDMIEADLKIVRDKVTKKPKENKNDNFKTKTENKNDHLKIKTITLKPIQHTKASQNIIKHSLSVNSPMAKNVKIVSVNIKDNALKRRHKINSAPFEQNKLGNQVIPLADGKLKEKLMPSTKLKEAERSQLYTNNETFKKTEIGDKDLKATTLKEEKSIVENKNINFIQPETKTQQFKIAKDSTKVDNDKCLATAFNKSCYSELKDETGLLNQTNERLSSIESVQQLQPDSYKDTNKIKCKTVDSQKSDDTNKVKQQTNEAMSDNEINLDCKNEAGDFGKEINSTEDEEHTTISSGEETNGIESEQENANSVKCQSTEGEESEEDVPSIIDKVLVEKAHPEECLSSELVSFNTAGEEGVFKTQKQIIGSEDKGKLIDMDTVLVKESRGTIRKTDDRNIKSIGIEKFKHSLKNLGNLETMKSKNSSNLDKSTLKPWKSIKELKDNVNSLKKQIKSGSDCINRRDISKQYISNKSGESTNKSTGSKLQPQKSVLKINSNKVNTPGKTLSLECVESEMKQTDKIKSKTINPALDWLDLQNNKSISDTKTQLVDVKKAQSIAIVKERKGNENIKGRLKKQSTRASELKIKTTQDLNEKTEHQTLKINKSKDDIKQTIVKTSGIKDNKTNEKMSTSKIKTKNIVVKKPSKKHVEENNGIQPKMKLQKHNSVKDTTNSLTQLSKSATSINNTDSTEGPKLFVIKDNVSNKQERNSEKIISKNKINKEISWSKSASDGSNISKSTNISSNHGGEKNIASNLKPNKEIKEEIRSSSNRLLLKKVNLKHENITNREISRMPYQNRANKANKLIQESELNSVTDKIVNNNEDNKEKSMLKEHFLVGKDKKLHQNLDFNTNRRSSLGPKINQPENRPTTNRKKTCTGKAKEYQTSIKSRNTAMITPIFRNREENNAESLNQNDESKKKTVLSAPKITESENKQVNKSEKSFMQNNKSNSCNTFMRINNPERLEDS